MVVSYRRNDQSVVSETFEDDTVLINFEKGTYFSLRGSAPRIWELLAGRAMTLTAIASLVGARVEQETAQILAMLGTLAAEGCIVTGDVDDTVATVPAAVSVEPFAPPLVEAFHDLKELIVIDPVHEVDDFDGWPNRPGPLALG